MNLQFIKRYLIVTLGTFLTILLLIIFKDSFEKGTFKLLLWIIPLAFVLLQLLFVKKEILESTFQQIAEKYSLSYNSDGSTASDSDAERTFFESTTESSLYQLELSSLISGTINGIDVEAVNMTIKNIPLTVSPASFVMQRRMTKATTRLTIGGTTKYVFQSLDGFTTKNWVGGRLFGIDYMPTSTLDLILSELKEKGASDTFETSYGVYPLNRIGFITLNHVYFYEGSRDNPSPRLLEKMKTPISAREKKARLIFAICFVALIIGALIFSADI